MNDTWQFTCIKMVSAHKSAGEKGKASRQAGTRMFERMQDQARDFMWKRMDTEGTL